MFTIGQRVKVNLIEIPLCERNCDFGEIIAINFFHRKSPLQKVYYTVAFDKPYIKSGFVIFGNIKEIQVPEDRLMKIKEWRDTDTYFGGN